MRLGIADLHGLLLVTLPPPEEVEGGRAKPTVLRVLSRTPFDQTFDDPTGVWSIEIGSRLMKLVGETGSILRYQADLDQGIGILLSDPVRYGGYHGAARILQVSGITSAKIEEAENFPPDFAKAVVNALGTVGSFHREFLERVGADPLSASFGWSFERMSALGAPSMEEIADEAPAVEPLRRITLSSSPVRGVAAVQIGIGSIISPESNRARKYRVHAVEEGGAKETLVFYVDPIGGGPRSYFTALELERIEVTTGVEAERIAGAIEAAPQESAEEARAAPVDSAGPMASPMSRALAWTVLAAGGILLLLLAL